MDLKTEIEIEEEEVDMQFEYPHPDAQDVGNYEKVAVAKSSRNEGSEGLEITYVKLKGKIMSQNSLMSSSKKKLFKCVECNFECDQMYNLKRHVLIHTKVKSFKCSECNYVCNQKANLKSHMLKHSANKLFKCISCSYSCNQKKSFKLHMLSHKEIKILKCTDCSYECKRKDFLAKHMLTHIKCKVKCPLCNFECEKQILRIHMLLHDKVKCPLCNFECEKQNLRIHMLLHDKAKLIKCSECRYQCQKEIYLKKHMLTHQKIPNNEDDEWYWSYKKNAYLMECYYIGEAICAKSENYIKEADINSNDLMEYMFKLKYKYLLVDRITLVKQKHRILFNIIKERQEYKTKKSFPSEEDLERLKTKAKFLVENEFKPSEKLIKKIKRNTTRLNKRKKSD